MKSQILLVLGVVSVILVAGCTSQTGQVTTKKEFIIDEIYKENARISAQKGVEYCDRHPYGVYRDVIYNGDGIGVPLTVECGGACIETGTCK